MATPFLSSSWYKVAGLRPRLRAHTRLTRHRYRGATWYVADDGAAGKSHRFSRGAYMLVGRLDGTRTVDTIWQELVRELDEEAPAQDEVIATLSELHHADLLASDMPPDTDELFGRYRKQRRQILVQNLKSPMSLRVPLVDPDAFLTRHMPYLRPLFGVAGGLLWLALVIPALFLASAHWDALTGNLVDRVLAVDNLLLLSLVYPVVKIVHELGHGFAAKARGREVRDMGVMFLLFYPIPYVDASAASALRSKWQRALIGAAGMIGELALAAIAVYVWVLLEPGLARAVAFNVILVAGISTVIVNGNPLLKFDGYYILADLIEIPNLASRSNRYWGDLIDRHVFRTHDVKPFAATPGEKRWFLAYAPASFVARMLLLFGIALIVAKQFFIFGVLMALWSLWSGIVAPAWKMAAHVVASPHLHRNRRRALRWSGGALAALLLLLFVLPAPHHTSTEGVVWLPDEAHVRARNDGEVVRLTAASGSLVRPGQPLAEAQRPALAAEVEALAWRVRELEAKGQAELTQDRVALELSRVELEGARRRLATGMARVRELNVASGAAGTFVLADTPAQDLPGRYLKKGDVIGYVTPDHARLARVAVAQDDIDLVRQHLRGVSFKVATQVRRTWPSHIVRAVPGANPDLPSPALAAANGGPFAVDPRDPQGRRALGRVFQFDISLPTELRDVPFGTRVFVRFDHEAEPIGWQIARRVRQLFLAQFDA
jgi:putative peptide zinc metalloprotease protein